MPIISRTLQLRDPPQMTRKSKPFIAIVDDDESVCYAIKRLVRSLGMEAATFASGQEFIDHIEAMPPERFDCIVLDVDAGPQRT